MKGVLLDECATTTFYPPEIGTVRPNEMKILVELEHPYISLGGQTIRRWTVRHNNIIQL